VVTPFLRLNRCKAAILPALAVVFCLFQNPLPAAPTAPRSAPASTAAPSPAFVVLTQPVKIRIAYGETTLPAGMRLPVVSSDTTSVHVNYMGQVQAIPSAATRSDTSLSERADASTIPGGNVSAQLSAPTTSAPAPALQISLVPGYDSRMQGGDVTIRELQLLLSSHCTEAVDLTGAGKKLYNGVTYLMDSEQAAAALGLGHAVSSRAPVATPGFPKNSTYCTGYDGAFEGRFNRLYLVTDAADKLVAVQLVDEHPNSSAASSGSTGRIWNTYNFLNGRMRASDAVRVTATSKRQGNAILVETRMSQLVRERKGHDSVTHYQEKEHAKLFLSIPFARIILHCAQAGLSKT